MNINTTPKNGITKAEDQKLQSANKAKVDEFQNEFQKNMKQQKEYSVFERDKMSSSHNLYQDGKIQDKFFRLTLNNGRVISAKERVQ